MNELYSQDPNLDGFVSARIKRAHQRSMDFEVFKDHMKHISDRTFEGLFKFIVDDELVGISLEEQLCRSITIHPEVSDVNSLKGMMNLMLCFTTWSDIVFSPREKSQKNSIPVSEIRYRLEKTIYMTRLTILSQYKPLYNEEDNEAIKTITFLPQFSLQLIVRYLRTQGIFIKWIEAIHQIDEIVNEERQNRIFTQFKQKDPLLMFNNYHD